MTIKDLALEELKKRAMDGDEEAIKELARRCGEGDASDETNQEAKYENEQTPTANLKKDIKFDKGTILAGVSILLSILKIPIIPLILAIFAYKIKKGILAIIALVISVGILLYLLQMAMFTDTPFFRILFEI